MEISGHISFDEAVIIIICILIAIIAWRYSGFFIAPRDYWRKSEYEIKKTKLDVVYKVVGTLLPFILVIYFYLFKHPDTSSNSNTKTITSPHDSIQTDTNKKINLNLKKKIKKNEKTRDSI